MDLLAETLASLSERPGRTALTALGTVFGVATLVATAGLADTAAAEILSHFDALSANTITVRVVPESGTTDYGVVQPPATLPWDSERRLTQLSGVAAAGTLARLDIGDSAVTSGVGSSHTAAVDIYASSPGLLDAIGGQLSTGRYFDTGHSERADQVAVVGLGAARRLGIGNVAYQPAVFVGDNGFTVIGVLGNVDREVYLLDAVLIPNGTAAHSFGLQAPSSVHVISDPHARDTVVQQTRLALLPAQPDEVTIEVSPQPEHIRGAVQADTNAVFLIVSAVVLLGGMVSIANMTFASVLERFGEIGLRRAHGGRSRHIAAHFLAESAGIGLVGGVIGNAGGIMVVGIVAWWNSWTPVLDPSLSLLAPLGGTLTGIVAGLYPAWRASRLDPIDALRDAK